MDDFELELLKLEQELQSQSTSYSKSVSSMLVEQPSVMVEEELPNSLEPTDFTYDPTLELQAEHQVLQDRFQRLRNMQRELLVSKPNERPSTSATIRKKQVASQRLKRDRKIRYAYNDEDNIL
ncbi:hypothetical protein BDEG_26275 [Batrachochytrium dendrobatidis JEL423]|uniref:Uncharacterized protein n=1 Tax=Batrachochytrium dendrobatidis (strain JEL423) TaxID=403673 RepID=A0A177WU24_BATDL|nr:hypothetical protein BDEG_26275 [Batrachochytrium dendrobatidis JEL423]